MRSAAIITPVLVSFAVASVTPRAEEDSPFIIQSFDVPGASEELGITVPKGAPEGLFSVTIGADGVAHHTRVELPVGGLPDLANLNNDDGETSSVSLDKRQSGWNYVCGNGRSMNVEATDAALIWLKWACGSTASPNWPGTEMDPHERFYIHIMDVVAYFCNFDRVVHLCKYWEVEEHLQGQVSRKCGAYKPGWATWGNYRISIGQQAATSDMYFCGQYN